MGGCAASWLRGLAVDDGVTRPGSSSQVDALGLGREQCRQQTYRDQSDHVAENSQLMWWLLSQVST